MGMSRGEGLGAEVATSPDTGPKIGFESDREDTDREEICLDGTLVLVGCGKSKRDPEGPMDVHTASTAPDEPMSGLPGADTGPAWRAEDLYTSTYFGVKREFAEVVTSWARGYDAGPWGILSAEHGVVPHWQELKPYDTRIDDLGDDPTNPEHRVRNSLGRRRPDGQEIVTEMDAWATKVAAGLCKWVAGFRGRHAAPWENDANELLVLAGQDYIGPLRERGVFEYGIARQTGNPNEGYTFPLETRFLFEEIPAGGNGEQMGWMSVAIEQLEPVVTDRDAGTQHELGAWTGEERQCSDCGAEASEVSLAEYDDVVYCEDCEPLGRCGRCDEWTHESGLGAYPLCSDCQTDTGGQKSDPLEPEPDTQQAAITDGGPSE